VGHMDLRPGGLQGVDRPVPAVGGLQHHVGADARLLDLQAQRDRVVEDAYRAQLRAVRCAAKGDLPLFSTCGQQG
jgi:hypothetical protein